MVFKRHPIYDFCQLFDESMRYYRKLTMFSIKEKNKTKY